MQYEQVCQSRMYQSAHSIDEQKSVALLLNGHHTTISPKLILLTIVISPTQLHSYTATRLYISNIHDRFSYGQSTPLVCHMDKSRTMNYIHRNWEITIKCLGRAHNRAAILLCSFSDSRIFSLSSLPQIKRSVRPTWSGGISMSASASQEDGIQFGNWTVIEAIDSIGYSHYYVQNYWQRCKRTFIFYPMTQSYSNDVTRSARGELNTVVLVNQFRSSNLSN